MSQYTTSVLEEQLKKSPRIPVGLPWRILIFSILILSTTTVTYLGITLGYKPYLNYQITTLDNKINELSKGIGSDQQENLVATYSQLANIQNLLNSHTTVSKLFDLLEKNTLIQVYYSAWDLSLPERKIKIDGSAVSYDVLSQQLEAFRNAPAIERVSLSDSKVANDGSVRFSIQLIFEKEFLK